MPSQVQIITLSNLPAGRQAGYHILLLIWFNYQKLHLFFIPVILEICTGKAGNGMELSRGFKALNMDVEDQISNSQLQIPGLSIYLYKLNDL